MGKRPHQRAPGNPDGSEELLGNSLMPTTPNGTAYTVTAFTTSAGETAWRGIADSRVGTSDIPVVLFCHGNPGSVSTDADTQFQLSSYANLRNWLMDNGWGFVEAHGAGANWGNTAGRLAYEAAYRGVKEVWDVGYNVVIGRSMGALVGAWLASLSEVVAPESAGFVSLSGTADLTARYSTASTTDKNNLNAAYGVSDASQWAAAVAGFDPMLVPLGTWDDRNALIQWDVNDGTVPYQSNGLAWYNKYSPRLKDKRTASTSGGDHNSTPNNPIHQAATIAFLDEVQAPVPRDGARVISLFYVLPNLDLANITSAGA